MARDAGRLSHQAAVFLQRRSDHAVQITRPGRLGDEPENLALVDQAADGGAVALGGVDHGDDVRAAALDGANQVQGGAAARLGVGQQHGHFVAVQQTHRLAGVACPQQQHFVAEHTSQPVLHSRVGIHQQDGFCGAALQAVQFGVRHRDLGRGVTQRGIARHGGRVGHRVDEVLIVPRLVDEAEHLAFIDRAQHILVFRVSGEQQAHRVG